jgi:hypothetical protein
MKTALTIIGGIFATLAAAVLIFWFGWLRPPSAKSVCDNVVQITKSELGKSGASVSDDQLGELEKECVARASTPPKFGRAPWVKRLKCMRDAKDFEGLNACDQVRSM